MTDHEVPHKWRPSLGLVIAAMLAIVISLPVASLLFFRFYDNQLVRETESELIAQGAAISAIMKHFILEAEISETMFGSRLDIQNLAHKDAIYTPLLPMLELADEKILPPRPKMRKAEAGKKPDFVKVGAMLAPIIRETQKNTLAGFRILDPLGKVISGREEVGGSLAHIPEIRAALEGSYKSVIRVRISDKPTPPIASISRGAGIRIFMALPVIINDQVAGVVYLSRTPSNVLKELYQQRWRLLFAVIFVLIATFLIGYIFFRTVKNPIEKLQLRSEQIGRGERGAMRPLNIHGSREVAELSSSMMDMARKLYERTDYINTFTTHVTHELKSPLTAIQGAAELLQDQANGMNGVQREKFLKNIVEDTDRSVLLLERLRELARADNPITNGHVSIRVLVDDLRSRFTKINLFFVGDKELKMAMTLENASIVFTNLIENAVNHGATEVVITANRVIDKIIIDVSDNGNGISPANATRIFDLFFTTRRDHNGTGVGLGIVKAMLKAHGSKIHLKRSDVGTGTIFEVELPVRSGL